MGNGGEDIQWDLDAKVHDKLIYGGPDVYNNITYK